ncbi:MAG: hypothetical protein SF187_26100 [Deltaproteobacteria bacterium]|nr:hypothetical protein [Deltaproteobacteria bacterium]
MKTMNLIKVGLVGCGLLGGVATNTARAEEAPATVSAVGTAVAPPAAPKPPYSVPWQLRPAAALTVLRSDTSVAFYDAPDAVTKEDRSGSTIASTFLASYKVTPDFSPLLRLAVVQNSTPDVSPMAAPNATSFVNPIVGATYARNIGVYKLAGFLGATVPIGSGGGDAPDKGEAEASARGIQARSAMDNAMFAVNYFTMIAGADAAYVANKLTVQFEFTVLELLRARGPDTQDKRRTNFTSGVHAGYFVLPMLSLGAEVRYQRWLTDAAPVKANSKARESVTVAFGPRFHFKVGSHWIRPGISYSRYLDEPFSKSHYQMLQVDVPFIF